MRPGVFGGIKSGQITRSCVQCSEVAVGHLGSFLIRSRPRMDRNPRSIPLWWLIVITSLYSLAESRPVYYPGSSPTDPFLPGRPGYVQPPLPASQRLQNAELTARPRPVVVNCQPEFMEVVVQADLFDRGILVDGRHLHLGSGSASEGSTCRAEPSGEAEFTVRAHLMDCGFKLSVRIMLFFFHMIELR